MRVACGAALLVLVLTGGCGQSEAQIRDELRAQMMQRCNRDIAPNTSALPNFDSNVYCGCVTGKAMGERSLGELKALFDDRARLTAEGRQAATECLAQQTGSGAAVSDGAGAEPAPEPAADPAPAKEKEREREAEPRRPRIEDAKESPQPRTERVTPAPRPPRPEPEPAPDDEEEEPSDRA